MRNTVILTALPARNLPARDLAVAAVNARVKAERLESLRRASYGGLALVLVTCDAIDASLAHYDAATALHRSMMRAIGI